MQKSLHSRRARRGRASPSRSCAFDTRGEEFGSGRCPQARQLLRAGSCGMAAGRSVGGEAGDQQQERETRCRGGETSARRASALCFVHRAGFPSATRGSASTRAAITTRRTGRGGADVRRRAPIFRQHMTHLRWTATCGNTAPGAGSPRRREVVYDRTAPCRGSPRHLHGAPPAPVSAPARWPSRAEAEHAASRPMPANSACPDGVR
jgi:hypothetical protein